MYIYDLSVCFYLPSPLIFASFLFSVKHFVTNKIIVVLTYHNRKSTKQKQETTTDTAKWSSVIIPFNIY